MLKRGDTMTLKEAYVVLRRFQDWRAYGDDRSFGAAFPEERTGDGKQLRTEAIDLILKEHGLGRPIANCADCRHWNIQQAKCLLDVRGYCTNFEQEREKK